MNTAEIELFARAACREAPSDLFVLAKEDTQRTWPRDYAKARTFCISCAIRRECLEYAMANRIGHGMWGGLTPAQRNAVRRRQLQAKREAT